jgi:hypothetical protein
LDFSKALELVERFFAREQFSWAVIGAVGLHAYGLSRTTSDLDFLTESGAQPTVLGFLASHGYATLHVSPGYSSHVHRDPDLGRIDFVYVSGETSRQIFGQCRTMAFQGHSVPVPRPEHLAAMKVQAMKNDPERALQDMADVRFLLSLPGVNEEEVRQYFEKSGLSDRYEQIKRLP